MICNRQPESCPSPRSHSQPAAFTGGRSRYRLRRVRFYCSAGHQWGVVPWRSLPPGSAQVAAQEDKTPPEWKRQLRRKLLAKQRSPLHGGDGRFTGSIAWQRITRSVELHRKAPKVRRMLGSRRGQYRFKSVLTAKSSPILHERELIELRRSRPTEGASRCSHPQSPLCFHALILKFFAVFCRKTPVKRPNRPIAYKPV